MGVTIRSTVRKAAKYSNAYQFYSIHHRHNGRHEEFSLNLLTQISRVRGDQDHGEVPPHTGHQPTGYRSGQGETRVNIASHFAEIVFSRSTLE